MIKQLADQVEVFLADHEQVYDLQTLKEVPRFKKYLGSQLYFALKRLLQADLVARTTVWPLDKPPHYWYMHIGFAYK